MEENTEFFRQPHSHGALIRFEARLKAMPAQDDFEVARNSHILTIVHGMSAHPEEWSTRCQINIEWIGSQFIGRLSDEEADLTKKQKHGISLFAMCFRFLFELYFVN